MIKMDLLHVEVIQKWRTSVLDQAAIPKIKSKSSNKNLRWSFQTFWIFQYFTLKVKWHTKGTEK